MSGYIENLTRSTVQCLYLHLGLLICISGRSVWVQICIKLLGMTSVQLLEIIFYGLTDAALFHRSKFNFLTFIMTCRHSFIADSLAGSWVNVFTVRHSCINLPLVYLSSVCVRARVYPSQK